MSKMTIGQALDLTVAELEKQAPDMEWKLQVRSEHQNMLAVHLYVKTPDATRGRIIGFNLEITPDEAAEDLKRGVASFRRYLEG